MCVWVWVYSAVEKNPAILMVHVPTWEIASHAMDVDGSTAKKSHYPFVVHEAVRADVAVRKLQQRRNDKQLRKVSLDL